MYHFILLLLLFVKYGAYVLCSSPSDDLGFESEIDKKWKLHPLETNPFVDLQHPNFRGDFIRSINEYYVFETEEYNAYKKERHNNIKNNIPFEKKQFHCAINVLLHGRPNSRHADDYRIWSPQMTLIKYEVMLKKKYHKYVVFAPFVVMTNFAGDEGVHAHANYAFLIANRMAMTFKNLKDDDTCHTYDVLMHSHCVGGNIGRIAFTLDKEIWKTANISLINMENERTVLAILNDNFKRILTDVNIITDKSTIKYRKDPYFKNNEYCLYQSFKYTPGKKKLTDDFEDIFDDYKVDYDSLWSMENSLNKKKLSRRSKSKNSSGKNFGSSFKGHANLDSSDEEDAFESMNVPGPSNNTYDNFHYSYQHTNSDLSDDDEDQISIKFVKRLHYHILNKKFNLLGATLTASPISGIYSNMEDLTIGYQHFSKYRHYLKWVPKYIAHKLGKVRDYKELFYLVNPEMLCLLAVNEKLNYNFRQNTGSLMTLFKDVNYYSDLDTDEMVSFYSALGIHSSMHMRSLSYFILNIRNEYYLRLYNIPAYLSDINVSNNFPFFNYIKNNPICKHVPDHNLGQFISFVNEIINYDQKPKPYIPNRYVYKNPKLSHFVLPTNMSDKTYTPHAVIGSGRTNLLLYTYDVYRNVSRKQASEDNVLTSDVLFEYEGDPLIFYNWLSYIGDQNDMKRRNFMQKIYLYSDNININVVDNLINAFSTTHYTKFFIFDKNHPVDAHKHLHRTLNNFSIPIQIVSFSVGNKKKITFPILNTPKIDRDEAIAYEYINRYTNFLQNHVIRNSFYTTTDRNYILTHKTFKGYQQKAVDRLRDQIKVVKNFINSHKTFNEMKKALRDSFNMYKNSYYEYDPPSEEIIYERNELPNYLGVTSHGTAPINTDNYINHELGDLESFVEENYPNPIGLDEGVSNDDSSQYDLSYYDNYNGTYLLVNSDLKLRSVYKYMLKYSKIYKNTKYIEFVMKNEMRGDVHDQLVNVENGSSCLFDFNDNIRVSYIIDYCNYDKKSYFLFYKEYKSKNIYSVPSQDLCESAEYSYLKLCQNISLLKKFFTKTLDTQLSEIHKDEMKRMTKIKNAIEDNIDFKNILSISNDSLVSIIHDKNEGITTFDINACFTVSAKLTLGNIFNVNSQIDPETARTNINNSIFCTPVSVPVAVNRPIMRSINDVYIRAIFNIMKDQQFREYMRIPVNSNPYHSFIYFFDKYAYVYKKRKWYKNMNHVKMFIPPQTIKWNMFYYLLRNNSHTAYNNEMFLYDFFYGKKSADIKALSRNIMKPFLSHFTLFFYLYKVDESIGN
ncbi:conserved Plasmodium protein, unknown function [Plasmodium chabaudi chabaudi]|uniref:Uncharacterized protein n=1 Tax=Plasmodium chabaudi chabaudi TaxID=31271 RepID=A0A1D3S3F8_PLACU|nr:conserved Plasmodium protein, unknown function [Plasmodium chabaudi chabaudi]